MGKTDHDQHQIDKNHYCSVTFSMIMNEIGLLVLQNPYDWRKWTLWCLIQANWYISDEKYVSHLGIG